MNQQNAPVQVGETHNVSINAVGGKGDGIAKVKGFVLFVASTKKGDYVKVRITKVLENVGFAEVVEKLEKPVKASKFQTITENDLQEPEQEQHQHYEDTEDFGGELDEE